MNNEPRVYVRTRRTKHKATYHLRWVSPEKHRWKSEKIGTDRRRAEREALKLAESLQDGTYQDTQKIGWQAFVDDHVAKIDGRRNAVEAKHTLEQFGRVVNPDGPGLVTYSMIERYIAELRSATKPNTPATIAKKLRYIRAALNRAIKRGYRAAKNPVTPDLFPKVESKPPRICTDAEEPALLDAAETLYGIRMRSFIGRGPGHGRTPWRASGAHLGPRDVRRRARGAFHENQVAP